MTQALRGESLFIAGGCRCIGQAIAVRAVAECANVVLMAETTEPNPKLPDTLYSAAEAVEVPGGRCCRFSVISATRRPWLPQ